MRTSRLWGWAWLAVSLATCQMEAPVTAPAAPAPPPRDEPGVNHDHDIQALAPTAADAGCMSDERQWGTTCCRSEGEGHHRWMSCRGPQLGKACRKKGDCDIACACDRALVHQDGKTGVTGTCTGFLPGGEWLCVLDEAGKVSSLIID